MNSLKQQLRDERFLLLLDSFEQVLSAAPLVAELLEACPRLKILVTSRAVLHLRGEHEYAVPPLAIPDLQNLPPLEALGQYGSVELFIQCAQAVKPDFTLTRENAPAVAEVCARLDGLPLALELAAARIKLLPLRAMVQRLQSRLKLLTGGARDLPARQQTMRGAIAWSYELLDQKEKALFRRLAVFVGGCTLEAAQAVTQASGELDTDVLEGMASLVNKSLMRQVDQADGEPRFLMLETIREYALECLHTSEESPALRDRHAMFHLKLAETTGSELLGPGQGAGLDRLETEHANLGAALEWLQQSGQTELALRLGEGLWRFWEIRGYLAEGRERLAQLLQLSGDAVRTKARMKVLYAAGVLADAQADYDMAKSLFEENLAINREWRDQWGIASSLNNLGIIALRQRDYAGARALYEESLEIW